MGFGNFKEKMFRSGQPESFKTDRVAGRIRSGMWSLVLGERQRYGLTHHSPGGFTRGDVEKFVGFVESQYIICASCVTGTDIVALERSVRGLFKGHELNHFLAAEREGGVVKSIGFRVKMEPGGGMGIGIFVEDNLSDPLAKARVAMADRRPSDADFILAGVNYLIASDFGGEERDLKRTNRLIQKRARQNGMGPFRL